MTKPKIVIFDLDNCLSDDRHRIHLIDWTQTNPGLRYVQYHKRCDEDRPGNIALFSRAQGPKAVFFTARPESVREQTRSWIAKNFYVYDPLIFMRPNDDHSSSVELKRRMLNLVLSGNEIVAAYDDRPDIVEMYKSYGIDAKVTNIHGHCAYTPPSTPVRSITMTEEERSDLHNAYAPSKSAPTPRKEVSAADVLGKMADTFRERNAVYGDNYKMVAKLMAVLFPSGVPSELVVQDHFHLFELMLVKLSRYAISGLTHTDSVHDLAVYAAMCEAFNLNNPKDTQA